jgi:hypothetical protein
MSKVNSLTQGKRRELRAALKEVEDLTQVVQVLDKGVDADEVSRPLAAEMTGPVIRILRSGPALVSLRMTPDEAQNSPPEGDTA